MLEMLGHGPKFKEVRILNGLCTSDSRAALLDLLAFDPQVQASQEVRRQMGSRLVPILQAGRPETEKSCNTSSFCCTANQKQAPQQCVRCVSCK